MKKIINCKLKMLFALALAVVVLLSNSSFESFAASAPKLSKTTLTFASPNAKAQTVTIKNLKTKYVKKITIYNDWKEWLTIKKKGKNKLVITPKRSSGDITYGISISIQYKKPVDGRYSDYLMFKKIKIKGKSTIAIKTAADLCKMRAGSYTTHRWNYYLANDIDMTGKGMVKYPGEWGSDTYSDIYLDGKGHTIKSDTPIFNSVGGVLKNIVFDVNINCTVSKKDANTVIWGKVHYNGYGGLAPIVYNNGKIMGCKSVGTITVNMDKDVTYTMSGGGESKITTANIAGLVEENTCTDAVISQCKSEVDITVNFAPDVTPFTYVGGLVTLNYGYSGNSQYASIIESQFAGSIKIVGAMSFAYAGGITGNNNANIKDCLNTGSVSNDSGSMPYAAGINGIGGEKAVERVLTVGDVKYGLLGNSISESSLEDGRMSEYKNAYYLSTKSDGFNYLGNPVEVPGTKGIYEEELVKQETFEGFDFEKVWKMGENGPELRNVP